MLCPVRSISVTKLLYVYNMYVHTEMYKLNKEPIHGMYICTHYSKRLLAYTSEVCRNH